MIGKIIEHQGRKRFMRIFYMITSCNKYIIKRGQMCGHQMSTQTCAPNK